MKLNIFNVDILFLLSDRQCAPSVDYNKWLKRIDTRTPQNETTNQNYIKVRKAVKQIRKPKTLI